MAKNIPSLHLDHRAVKQMQIAAAQRAASDLEDDIARLNNPGPSSFNNFHFVLSLPYQRLHFVGVVTGGFVVGDILLCDGGAVVPDGLFGLESRL